MSGARATAVVTGRRRAGLVAALLVALALLAGCVRVDGELTVNGTASDAPDTVSGTMLVAISDEWAIAQGTDPARLSEVIAEELGASEQSGITGEPYAADGYTGTTLTLDEVPLERLALASDGALEIERSGSRYTVSGDLAVLNDSLAGEGDGATDPTPWRVDLSVTMPEDVDEHDGEVDGTTVTWAFDETSADPTLTATSDVGPVAWWSRVPVWLVVATVLAGLGAWWWSRRRGSDDDGPGGRRGRAAVGERVAAMRERQARLRSGESTSIDDVLHGDGR